MFKKSIAYLLTLFMMLSVAPVAIYAEEENAASQSIQASSKDDASSAEVEDVLETEFAEENTAPSANEQELSEEDDAFSVLEAALAAETLEETKEKESAEAAQAVALPNSALAEAPSTPLLQEEAREETPALFGTVDSGTCGENLTWTLDDAGTLTISGTGAMRDYYYFEIPWHSRSSYIETIIIQNGVTSIGDRAFYDCQCLTTIAIPDSVTSIGDDAFYRCHSLTTVAIPDSVTIIGDRAFFICSHLTTVTLGDGVTSIGDRAFDRCRSLTTIAIPGSVTSIGASAFSHCDNLTTVTLGDGVTSIGGGAFVCCYSLTTIAIPDSVTSIGDYAFYSCYNLTTVTLGDGVTSIGASAFYDCDSLTTIAIPDSVTSIGDEAFYNCDSLTTVAIPDSVTSIGDSAFCGCDRLTTIEIPDSVTSIGGYAFSGCDSLTTVTLDNGVTSIGERAFSGCTSLTTIAIPDSMTSIGRYAFYECDSLTSVTIGDGATSIGYSAFYECESLTTVTIGDGATSIGEDAFRYCDSLTTVTIGDGATSIGNYAFYDCDSLTTVTLGDGVTSIGENAFAYCSSLTTIAIPDSVTSIGAGAFNDCVSLTTVTLGDGVTSIGDYAFSLCDSLTNVYYGGTEAQWNAIDIGDYNSCLTSANIYFQHIPTYTITYDYATNGGTWVRKTMARVAKNELVDLSVTATKPGWEFVGWSTEAGTSTVLETCTARRDMTLYAVFKKTATVNFYAGAGSLQFTQTMTLYNNESFETITVPAPLSFNGWTAMGWRDDTTANGAEYYADDSVTVTHDKDFYAVYNRSVTVTYHMNGKEGVAAPSQQTKTQYYNASGTKSSCSFTMPQLYGAGSGEFMGWAKNGATGSLYQAGETLSFDDHTIIYAVWPSTARYTLTYKARINGRSYEQNGEYVANAVITLPDYPFDVLPEGAAFVGYVINRSEVKYPGDSMTITGETRADLNFTSQLITQFRPDTKIVSASYAKYNEYTSVMRGFKYKEISETTYTPVLSEFEGEFIASLQNLPSNREYDCYAFDEIDVNGRKVTVNGTKIRIKTDGKILTLSDTYLYLQPNAKYTLTANFDGDATIIWSSADSSVAKVNARGMIHTQNDGSTVITASTANGLYQAYCNVTVDSSLQAEYDFSEWNLAMKMSSNGAEINKSGLETEVYGANVMVGLAGLARWDGAVNESEDRYPTTNTTAYNSGAVAEYHIQNAYMLPSRVGYKLYPNSAYNPANDPIVNRYVDNVKRAISHYGAVYTAFYAYADSWNRQQTNFYNNDSDGAANGHAIVIVGWDDNYSKLNFAKTPHGDGAFICKNSYGTGQNDAGYFYLSYYDAGVGIADHTMVFPGADNVDNYDTIYEHDPFGAVDTLANRNEIVTANVFEVKSYGETLEAVSFYTYDMATNYEIYVVTDYENATSLNEPGNVVASGSLDYAGYHTVKFNSIPLEGERFAVVVKLIKNGYDVHAYLEMPLSGNDIKAFYAKNARANSGESFVRLNNGWVDLASRYANANNCIKAFTRGGSELLSLMSEKVYETDKIMTIEEAEQAGLHINPAFKAYFEKDDVALFATDGSVLIPSSAGFGSYDSNLTDGDIHSSYYNLRDYDLVTSVKNQGAYQTCWAHAIYGSLESCMLKRTAKTGNALLNGGIGSSDAIGELINAESFTSVSDVMLDSTDYQTAVGNTIQLYATIYPTSAVNTKVSWFSSDPAVAVVDSSGKVTAAAIGEAVITVITADGNKTDSCVVTVTEAATVESIEFSDYGRDFSVGDKTFLPYTVSPVNAKSQGVTWQSSDENIATVDDNGLISMVNVGDVTITLTDKASGCQTSVTLYVNDGMPVHTTTTLKTAGDYYFLNFTVDNQVEGMQIMVSSYTADGRMLTMDSVSEDLLQVILEKNDEIAYFKTFVWGQDFEALSVAEIIQK